MSAYEDLLQKQPKTTAAGNTRLAEQFVLAINAAMTAPVFSTLSTSQQNYLYKLRNRWEKRASGTDLDWNVHGSTPGRRPGPRSASATLDPTVWGDDDERDPLLVSLERKFGRPK